MKDEFSTNQVPENNESLEYKPSLNNPLDQESIPSSEFEYYEEYTDNEGKQFNTPERKTKNNHTISQLSVGVVTAITAVAVGITSWINVGMKASFNEVKLQDGIVSYEVSVENMTQEETLIARLYSSEELVFEQYLIDEDNDGIIVGQYEINPEEINKLLEEKDGKLTYRLNLSGIVGLEIERKFDSFIIDVTKMESRFESVTGKCHCGEDGCFHFTLNYSDDMQIFKDFNAKIEDEYGNTAYCVFTENPHEEQTIFVANLKGTKGVLTVTYIADGQPQEVKIDIEM